MNKTSHSSVTKAAEQALELLHSRWPETGDAYPDLTRKYYKLLEKFCARRDEALALANRLIDSDKAYERFFGIQVMNRIFNPTEPEHIPEARRMISRLATKIPSETNTGILTQIAYALGKPYLESATKPLIELSKHDDVNVVSAAVQSFNAMDATPDYAIHRLIQLSVNYDADVRNWATFQLGTQMSDVHRNDISRALRARLRDRHNETRREAFRGLAYRNDPAGIEPLKQWLFKKAKTDRVMTLEVEAAGAYGSPTLYKALTAASKSLFWRDSELMSWALTRCDPDEVVRASVPSDLDDVEEIVRSTQP